MRLTTMPLKSDIKVPPIDFDDRFEIDEDTGELLGPKLTPYQLALNEGVDWYKGLDSDDIVDVGIVDGDDL